MIVFEAIDLLAQLGEKHCNKVFTYKQRGLFGGEEVVIGVPIPQYTFELNTASGVLLVRNFTNHEYSEHHFCGKEVIAVLRKFLEG